MKFFCFLFLISILSFSSSVKIGCDLRNENSTLRYEILTCSIAIILPDDKINENDEIESCENSSKSSSRCDSAIAISAFGKKILYFPRGLQKIFPKLFFIFIINSQLREIRQEDLQGFTKLRELNLQGNEIKSLKKNLFDSNPELEVIFLCHNKISSVDPEVFSNLNYLKVLSLLNNTCINKKIVNLSDTEDVRNRAKKAAESCNLRTENFLKRGNQAKTTKISSSYLITSGKKNYL